MSLVPCASCGQHHPTEASACPHCGAAPARRLSPTALLLGLGLLGVHCGPENYEPPYGISSMPIDTSDTSDTSDTGT